MPEHDDPIDEESTWPAVASAYDFVMPSYRLLSDRFDAAEARLGSLFGVTSTLTLAAPVFARTVHPEISFTSPWFLAAVVLFLASAVVSIVGRMRWYLMLPNPTLLYQRHSTRVNGRSRRTRSINPAKPLNITKRWCAGNGRPHRP